MQRKVVVARRVPSGRKARRWLGVNEELGLSTLPDPDPAMSGREAWPGLPVVVQRALIKLNREQDCGVAVPAEYVAALLGCGEFFECDLDARSEADL